MEFLSRTPEDWSRHLAAHGGRAFHGTQIFRWIHARGVLDPAEMTDLSKTLREVLTKEGLASPIETSSCRRATDGTRKVLFKLHDGFTIESVLIPTVTRGSSELPSPVPPRASARDGRYVRSELPSASRENEYDDEEDEGDEPLDGSVSRVTQCISTQVGCAMGCVFCASGVAGIKRHLTSDEIIAQVLVGRAMLDDNERLTNVVYMGMGEPLHNYDATVRSLRVLTNPSGIGLSGRRVTVSTSGLVPEIKRLGEDFGGQIALAISLHAADDETRSRLMPINKKYPLSMLLLALRDYPLPKRRRITIEYTLVAGQNDNVDEARKLARLLRGLRVKVNLIPMNPISLSTLGPPSLKGTLAFQKVLCDEGYSCFIRRTRGDDVDAACGQLALLGAKPKVKSEFRARD